MPANVTVLSTADFDSTVWTNKQYLAVGLASRTSVTYVESMGLRAPTMSRADLRRVVQRVKGSTPIRQTNRIPLDLRIVSPKVLPFHGIKVVRRLNRELVRRTLLPKLSPGLGDVLWTFSPLTYGLENHYSTVVYHSVDLLHALPGVPSEALLEAEGALVQRADHVLASSSGVATHLRSLGAEPALWENVADVETFSSCAQVGSREGVVFAGNITPTKVDFSLVVDIAQRGIPVTLAGPVSIDGVASDRQLQELLQRPNVTYVGNRTITELAELFGKHKVGIIPYNVNAYTSGVFPLKVYEYLAAGLSVVSTPLQSLHNTQSEGVKLVDPNDFGEAVDSALRGWSEAQAKKYSEIAQGHSWSGRIDQAWSLIKGRI